MLVVVVCSNGSSPASNQEMFDIVKTLPPEKIFTSIEELDEYLAVIQRKVRDGQIE